MNESINKRMNERNKCYFENKKERSVNKRKKERKKENESKDEWKKNNYLEIELKTKKNC